VIDNGHLPLSTTTAKVPSTLERIRSIVLSIIAMNIDRLAAMLLRLIKFILSFFVFDNRKLKFGEGVTY
jgi:hypothetical protein